MEIVSGETGRQKIHYEAPEKVLIISSKNDIAQTMIIAPDRMLSRELVIALFGASDSF